MEVEANPKVESNMKNCMISQNGLYIKVEVGQASKFKVEKYAKTEKSQSELLLFFHPYDNSKGG